MDTTKESFRITLDNIAADAVKLGMLADGVRLEYKHNGQGLAPVVYAVTADGSRADGGATRQASEILPLFTYKFTRRESMAALEATERALHAAVRVTLGMPGVRTIRAWDTNGATVEIVATDYAISDASGRTLAEYHN